MEVTFKNKKLTIPNTWEDLSPEQYALISELIQLFLQNNFDVWEFRIYALQALTGYKRSGKRFSDEEAETINGNLSILSEYMRFVTRPEYDNKEMLESLSEELQAALKERFPFEIYSPELIDELAKHKLECRPVINLNMKKNPLPFMRVNSKDYWGVVFDIDNNGVVETNLTAGQYIDAYSYAQIYASTGDMRYLNNLTSILYPDGKYETYSGQFNSRYFSKLNNGYRYGVYLFFNNITEFLTSHPFYGILFRSTGSDGGLSLGITETLYNIVRDGYAGDLPDAQSLLITDYLNIMLTMLRDSVRQMRNAEMDSFKIAEKLHMHVNDVDQL